MQVYKGMDIGTAKVSQRVQEEIPHHLIDIREIDEPYNVVDFCESANSTFVKIFSAGHVPIVVGGTGFYLHSLLYGPPIGPPSVPNLRKSLEKEIEKHGTEFLFNQLQRLDPEYAATITCRDRQKIIRGLEIISLTHQKVSAFRISTERMQRFSLRYNFRCWFVYYPKQILDDKIAARCQKMIEQGFLEEIKRLQKRGLEQNPIAVQAIGYRQGLAFLRSEQTKEDWEHFVQSFTQASRRYAKRQFTWFKREPLFRWINAEEIPKDKLIELMIQDYELSF